VVQRRTLGGGISVVVSTREESDGFLVAFTERTGGASRGAFRSLNLGLRSGDDPERVKENRRRVCAALGIPSFACGQQVHGARTARIGPRRAGAGFADAEDAVPEVDALITSSRGVAMAVLVADCVPLALVDPAAGRLAVVHAGWKGVAAGIVQAALGRFGDPAGIRATMGPAIGPDHYEVGEDVALAVSAASGAGAKTRRVGARLYLDLPGTVASILKEHGVRTIERSRECTACQKDRLFSHRRDGQTGRQALIAMRHQG
jgi:YfiH family protein